MKNDCSKAANTCAIMLLGTASSAGKSTVAIGLCRLLTRLGYKVKPFKSQNMSRQYFSLSGDRRISVAQALMAEACNCPAEVEMNPILLCPKSDSGSDIYLQGEFWKSLRAKEYYQVKSELWPLVQDSYAKLAEDADIVVVEGAGSPAEINLQKDDFVNLGLASRLQIPCILVGDIDRGGVFASLYGTVALCKEQGGEWIKALCVNKFRGDISILEPGLEQFSKIVRLPFIGTLPYLTDLRLEAEDSLSEQEGTFSRSEREMAYERLADSLAENWDMPLLFEILGLKME